MGVVGVKGLGKVVAPSRLIFALWLGCNFSLGCPCVCGGVVGYKGGVECANVETDGEGGGETYESPKPYTPP